MSFINKINFKESETKFADNRKMIDGSLNGIFTRDQIIKEINIFARQFNDKNVQIGISMHYKKINKWAPALISPSDKNIVVWDSSDSPEMEEAYKNDTIDYVHVYVIENKNMKNSDVFFKRGKKL